MKSKIRFSLNLEEEKKFPVDMDYYFGLVREGKDYLELKKILKEKENLKDFEERIVLNALDEAIVENEKRKNEKQNGIIMMSIGLLGVAISFVIELFMGTMDKMSLYFLYAIILIGLYVALKGFRRMRENS